VRRSRAASRNAGPPPGASEGSELPASQRRILAAAAEAFAKTGYAGTATSVIARLAGVAEGTIFRYYPTKKALLIAAVGPLIVRTMSVEARARVAGLLAADYSSVDAFVRAVAADRLAFARENPALVRLVVQEISFHPELRRQFQVNVVPAFYPLLIQAIVRLQRRALIGDIAPASAARLILSCVIGYALPRLFFAPESAWNDDDEIATMARVLAHGLAPPVPARAASPVRRSRKSAQTKSTPSTSTSTSTSKSVLRHRR
jgi:AcrR family transcriptional regulator